MLLERLNENDLLTLEMEKNPTPEMVRSLISKIREIKLEADELQLELDSIMETLEQGEVEIGL